MRDIPRLAGVPGLGWHPEDVSRARSRLPRQAPAEGRERPRRVPVATQGRAEAVAASRVALAGLLLAEPH